MNENIEYKLGNISAKLEENDRTHKEMTNYLYDIQCSINRIEENLTENREAVAGLQGKASMFGAVSGFFVSIFLAIIGWIVYTIKG